MDVSSNEGRPKRALKSLSRIIDGFEELLDSIKTIAEISKMSEVARRYAVTNSFDSLLTMLGVLMGSFISGLKEPSTIANTILGGAVAILISGTIGTYLTERAERASRIKELEGAVLMELDKTLVGRAESISAVMVALVSGAVPFLIMIIILAPFYLSVQGLISTFDSYIISMIEALSILFLLGAFLGSLSGENKLLYGAILVSMGVLIVVVMMWLGIR
ncbi:MAG: hypothetical protein DRN78_01715 [Thermoproteota archaeon]|nr:MAG: hypothetical protein DRN78_01715 [Candidatus Korarchaeota archaeon]